MIFKIWVKQIIVNKIWVNNRWYLEVIEDK